MFDSSICDAAWLDTAGPEVFVVESRESTVHLAQFGREVIQGKNAREQFSGFSAGHPLAPSGSGLSEEQLCVSAWVHLYV